MAPCVTAGGGGGMLGGVDLDCVFTSAGESGMVAVCVSALSAGRGHGTVSGVCWAAPRFALQTGLRSGAEGTHGDLGLGWASLLPGAGWQQPSPWAEPGQRERCLVSCVPAGRWGW